MQDTVRFERSITIFDSENLHVDSFETVRRAVIATLLTPSKGLNSPKRLRP